MELLTNPVKDLIEASNVFMPHGFCFQWNVPLISIFAGSNIATALAYFWISFMIFKIRRMNLYPDFRSIEDLFITFIFLCGVTHLIDVVTVWYPAYFVAVLVDLMTAFVSIFAAVLMKSVLQKILKIY